MGRKQENECNVGLESRSFFLFVAVDIVFPFRAFRKRVGRLQRSEGWASSGGMQKDGMNEWVGMNERKEGGGDQWRE